MLSFGENLQKAEKAHLPNSKKLDTMEIFKWFLGDSSTSSLKLKPSVYLREMMLSTDHRIEQLNKPTSKKIRTSFLGGLCNKKDFRISPQVVLFQSFQPGKQYSATLTICNVSEVSKLIGIKSKPANTFSVSYLSKVTSKLAPGMSLHFLVKFLPLNDQDYSDCLTIETDSYTFDVHLIGLGSRPLVNFPDFVDMKETLVKVPSEKTFYVKNVGQIPATFNLVCEKPFSVYPERCIMEPGKIVMITIRFESDILNDFFKNMLVRFETGEELYIDLSGSTKNGKIWLDSKQVTLEDTFMGLKRQQKVTLYNDTDVTVRFSWHMFETPEQDLAELERIKEGFEKIKVNETVRCAKLEYDDIIAEDNHANVYSRILKDQVDLLSPKDLYFHHENFDISPLEGELWPGGRCVVTVTFAPRAVGPAGCVAYCDVAGAAQRLPLQMAGLGLGPVVQLNCRSLDIGPIFLGLTQSYEIVAANKGDIMCRIEHTPTQPVFGGVLTVQPPSQCLMPYEMKSFVISFCSGRTGSFVEDVFFKIAQSGEVMKIMLKGTVVNPTISFDCAKLDFGSVAVGFPKTLSVGLVNQSQVPVEFALRVPSDGSDAPVTSEHFAAPAPKPGLVGYCKEFTISPDSGVIDPNTTLTIEVTLITNSDRRNVCTMVAENKNSKLLESISLQMVYEARVATLSCDPPELILRFSFINFEYKMDFTLTNTSDLPAYFYFPPQTQSPLNSILYTLEVTEGLLAPNESITLSVAVVPVITGRVRQDIMVLLFGQPDLTSLCSISCSVQGPNVSSNVVSLEYGKMTLMEPKTLSFDLSNDSPISGYFSITIEERTQSKWTVEPTSGTLGPGEVVTVNVTLQVLDPGTISTALSIQVENSRVISIGLFASASGCGITIEPNIFPEINLGYLFSRRLYQFVLTLYNPGSRHHFITFVQDRMSVNSSPTLTHQNLVRLNPNKFDLLGGDKVQVMLECQSNREVDCVEAYSCLAIINKRGVKQNLGNFVVRATFIAPMVEVSEERLEFEINIGPTDTQGGTTYKSLTMKSVASLPITVVLELNSPFLILENDEQFNESIRELEPNEETEVILGFCPPPQYNLVSIVYTENLHISYKEHPQKDKVMLKGMLNFPNLHLSQQSLDFECIPLDTQDHKQIYMVNPTPLPVEFSFSFDPKSILVAYFEQENIEDIAGEECPEELRENPLYHNSTILAMENKESTVTPIPLFYVEPVAYYLDRDSPKKDRSSVEAEEMTDIHGTLFPVIRPYFSPERPTPEFNVLPLKPHPKPDVSQVFDLSPMAGCIPPRGAQVLNVGFRPQPYMGAAATAVCTLVGGPTETVRLSGQSSRHVFSVSTTFINFGFRMFMEPCEETVKITNLSQLAFHFKVSSALSPPMTPEVYDVQVGCLTVEPCFGYVPAHSSAAVTVKFYPGLAGEFQQQFTIQIGYLDPVNILVTGYGVVPQVVVHCPHVSKPRIPINWGYQGVASLTARRFQHLATPFRPDAPDDPADPANDPELEDYKVISYSERVPSAQDIWLALERVIAYNYIRENSFHIFRTGDNSKKLFQQCFTPGYLLDLGSVVLNTTTNVTVHVENRGLVRCDVRLVLPMQEKKLKHLGFFVTFQNHIGLPVGKSVPLDITIKPTSGKYNSKEEPVHLTFYLQVASGASVPIYLKALFTVPYVVVDTSMLDFGSVQCGQCKKMCLLLKNSGAVKADWSVSLVAIKRKKQGKFIPEEFVRFSVDKTSGMFHPKTAELLEIGFTPKEERFYETTLRLEVKHNPEVVLVRLCGYGIEPKVTLSPKTVQFGTHVPFSGPIECRFTISNPCPFNVQVYFPDFDKDIIKEDRILRVLTNYYKSDSMLLPLEVYDKVPTAELEEFYDLVEKEASVVTKFKDYKDSASVNEDQPRRSSRRSTKASTRYSSGRSSTLETAADPFTSLSPAEIEKRILEVLAEPDSGLQLPKDPLGLEARCVPRLADEMRDKNKGILNVFHGAPQSEYQFLANRAGRILSHKVVTLDELVLREAAASDSAVAARLQDAINTAYIDRAGDQDVDQLTDGSCRVGYEELCERVNFLKSFKEPVITEEERKKSDKKSPGSKPGSAKKKASLNKPPQSTFNDIPVETFIDLIGDRLLEEVEKGLVLESLTGFFLKTVNAAVNVILRCAGHISCLRFVSIFGDYALNQEQLKKGLDKQESFQKQAEAEKLMKLDYMTSEELKQASPEDKALYEKFVLEERRQWVKEMKQKKEERMLKTPAASPQTTARSKGEGKKSGKKSSLGTTTTKASKTKDKSNKTEDGKSKSENVSSKGKGKKTSLKTSKTSKVSDKDLDLKEGFEMYKKELEELVFLLSRWNKDIREFEGLDKPSSFFNVKAQSKPQSRKGKEKDTSRKASEDTGVKKEADIGVKCVIFFQRYNKIKFEDAVKFMRVHTTFREYENIAKEWWDTAIPDPLILSAVNKPEIRTQNDKLPALSIFDYKRKKTDIKMLEDSPQTETKLSEGAARASKDDRVSLEERRSVEEAEKPVERSTSQAELEEIEDVNREAEGSGEMNREADHHSSVDQVSKESSMVEGESIDSMSERVFTSRVELAPGEERTWSMFFDPDDLGIYDQHIRLEVAGWRKKYHVIIEAECDISHIDTNPNAMFEKVHDTLSTSTISQCVFLLDKKIFYFGPVFATEANKHRTNDLTTNFYFTNISLILCEIEFAFMSNKGSSAFGFKPSILQIPPGETKALEVFACPTSVGKYSETLVFSIYNNAKPEFIEMSCIGVKPDFEFEPKEIRFERVLLYRKEFSELTLSNKCYKPLGWRLVDLNLLSKQVSVSQQSGVIPAMQSTSVYINFSAAYVEVAHHIITIEVFDDQFRGTPFVSEPIPVVLESVDVLVDLMFPQGCDDSELKFQSLKVGEAESQTVVLKNLGKYDVTFSIKFNEEVKLHFKPEQVFSFTPKNGTVPKDKSIPVKITCMCTRPVHLKKVAVFKVWLVDTGPGAQPVAAIPIDVTIEAFTSEYRVIPEDELNFSSMLVGSKKVESLIIENIGKFEFMFQILTLEQLELEKSRQSEQSQLTSKGSNVPAKTSKSKTTQDSARDSIKTGKGGKGSLKTEKGKKAKGKEKKESLSQKLVVGAFTLSHREGVVAPGETFKIDVECFTPTQGTYQEEVVIKVLEYATMKKGTHLKLKAISYLPFINFENVSNIFQEAKPQNLPPDPELEGEPYIAYDSETNILHFYNGCVGAQASMNLHLHLYNSGKVPCEASATIVTTNEPAVFCATPDKFTIMSHSELNVMLMFRPTQIGEFHEVLEVKVELPSPLEPQVFTVQLFGEAFLPRITVTSPPFPHKLTFPPTVVEDFCDEAIVFVNSGHINCTVVVEMMTSEKDVLAFFSEDRLIKGNYHQLHLKKGKGSSILARFSPNAVGEVTGQVRLMVTNNPYEDQTVELEGVGYMRDIVVDGLPLVKGQNLSDLRSSKAQQLSLKYELALAPCSVGEFAKRVFSVRNQTRDAWYRFQWDDVDSVTISPSVGHLPPDSSKEVLVVFQSHEPNVLIENEEVRCSLTQIKLADDESHVGWDNHQKTIRWIETEDPEPTGSRRVVVSRDEPAYEEVPGTSLALAVLVSACADYPRVSCPADDILFPTTIVNQTAERRLVVRNEGVVTATFAWAVRGQLQRPGAGASVSAVTMSSERPALQPRPPRTRRVSVRPATCCGGRPAPIPATVALLSQDDLCVKESLPLFEPKSGWPISVEPSHGKIQPGEEMSCTIMFKPLELASYSCELHFRIEEADPETAPVVVRVEGASSLPCCHLVVADCTPASDPALLQVKFRALGTKKPVSKCVKVVNTTNEEYTFYWKELDQEKLTVFGCSKPISQVGPAKHVEVVFSFTPSETGQYQSLWQLSIPERQVLQNVLLLGEAAQPYVTLSPTFLQLRPTIIGVCSEGRVALVNHEDCEFKFNVDQNSLHCGTWGQAVQVLPARGVLPAQGQLHLRVSLTPTQAGEGQFAVKLCVQRLETPLQLNVTAQCYSVRPQLVYQDSGRGPRQLLPDRDNVVDVGVVEVRIPVTLTFDLTNIGKPVFHYSCVWSSEEAVRSQLSVSVANKSGLVGPQSKQQINVVITPLARTVFSKVKFEILVNKGPKYSIFINGTAAQPLFKFSTNKFDFGPCFVLPPDVEYYKTDLVFTNTDEKPLLLEMESDPLPHLTVGLTQTVVGPRAAVSVPVTFHPRACRSYDDTLRFLVDGGYRHDVVVTGRGVELNVMLADPADKLVDLEGVAVGKVKRRCVTVVNNSEASVAGVFTLEPPQPQVGLSPREPVVLRPRQTTELCVSFAPDAVVKGIQQELVLNFQSVRRVLSAVKVGSVGVSVRLDRDFLAFGSIAVGNSPSTKLLLINDGDLAVKFSWHVNESQFKILPSEGFISPGIDVVLTVKFSPQKIQAICYGKGVCTLSNGEQLTITLSGSCVDLPPPTMTIPMSCPVRTSTTTQIPVFNKFGHEIELTANISGDYFTGNSSAMIPPYGTHMFEITYAPLTMTTSSQLHEGTAIFYFVDGTCLVYSLQGAATEPAVSERLTCELVTHTEHELLVPVRNWLPTPQKFHVTHELLSSEPSQPAYQLSCNEYFMVSGSQTRDLSLKLICHFPGSLVFKVVLTNDTGDYLWYEVTLEVAPCASLGDIVLEGCVRHETRHKLTFHNPLDCAVTVACRVEAAGLAAVNTPLTVAPETQEAVQLRYWPLWPSEPTTSTLELSCEELGVFPYTVTVTAAAAPPPPPLPLRCDLGRVTRATVALENPADTPATFQCSSSHEDISVEPQVVLGPNESKAVEVTFQPSSLSDVKCDIVATSAEAGDFIFPVIGICNYPEPRGPYKFTPGSSNVVSFKNVYRDQKTFVIFIENPAFTVKKDKINLKHNEVTEITIEMLEMEDKDYPMYPVTGKMTVFAEDETLSHIKWVFYLHGEIQTEASNNNIE